MADPTAPQITPLFGVPTTPVQPAAATPTPVAPPAPPQKYVEQDGKHRGVAGVARDILGTLGDFLLTRLRMPAMYAPAQRDRKLAAAQANIDTDPIGAIQQVSSIDPVFGAKLRDQYIDNQRLAASAAAAASDRQAAQELRNQQARDTALRIAAQGFNGISLLPEDKQAGAYTAQRGLWGQSAYLKKHPEVLQELQSLYPETYDPETVALSVGRSVPVNQQWSNTLAKIKRQDQVDQAGVDDAQAATNEQGRNDRFDKGEANKDARAAAGRAAADARNKYRVDNRPPPRAPAPKPLAKVKTRQDVAALPSGTRFVGPDGKIYTRR